MTLSSLHIFFIFVHLWYILSHERFLISHSHHILSIDKIKFTLETERRFINFQRSKIYAHKQAKLAVYFYERFLSRERAMSPVSFIWNITFTWNIQFHVFSNLTTNTDRYLKSVFRRHLLLRLIFPESYFSMVSPCNIIIRKIRLFSLLQCSKIYNCVNISFSNWTTTCSDYIASKMNILFNITNIIIIYRYAMSKYRCFEI